MNRFRSNCRLGLTLALLAALASPTRNACADDPSLADFFGFADLEIVKIGKGAGPLLAADMNGDGLTDLIAVNNSSSRIEVHYQKKNATPDDEIRASLRVNEFPEHWRFRREFISLTHRVTAVVAHDVDADGLMDLIYAGVPQELVIVRQQKAGDFKVSRKHPVKDLAANPNALTIADVMGDNQPEIVSLVKGDIAVWTLTGETLSQPTLLKTGAVMIAAIVDDYDGDGLADIAGIIPDDAAPVRMWFGAKEGLKRSLGPETRFEMPAITEFEPIHLPKESFARVAVIERASKRFALSRVVKEDVAVSGDRDASLEVHGFTDAGNRKRDLCVIDADGDGLLDLLATDTQANTLVTFRQVPGHGFESGESHPGLSEATMIAAGNVDDDPQAEIFVLSEKEGVVGRSDVGADGLHVPFPQPMGIPDGHTPVAMNLVQLEHGPHVAVVAKSGRDFLLYLIDMTGQREKIELGAQSRAPDTILAVDADQDGRTDLLLLTRDKPMTMLLAQAEGFKLLESKDMGQFGLVQAATADNTAVLDVDGDGHEELLIADKNYIRAVRYASTAGAGGSPGWQVVSQLNASDPTAKLVSIALLNDRIVVADKENNRILVMTRDADSDAGAGSWRQLEALNVKGFALNTIFAGAFTGSAGTADSTAPPDIVAVSDDGFAVIRLSGQRVSMEEFAAWRTDEERRMQHELVSGDINSDGFTDLVSLDAGEQMCELFTFTEAANLLYVTGFKVFESKIFSGGEAREYEPRQAIIADLTGDGANDLILLSHDRALLYPQMRPAR